MERIILENSELLELCSELAHDRASDEANIERKFENINTYKDENAEVLEYTEEFQEIFNRWYDYFYNKILDFKYEE